MIVYDMEVFKYDWMICYLDTATKKLHSIINDREAFKKFYEKYKNQIWVGYNSRGYDQWVAKTLLADFDPYDITKFIIEDGNKGFQYSNLLHNYPILNYDCSVGFRSLKELEGFMGHDIRETDVPFDLDRPLTKAELDSTEKYCKHDVMETFEVFVNTAEEFESHVGLLQEFELPLNYISKTKAQLSAVILGAVKHDRDDEFDITIPDTLDLEKYKHITKFYENWAENEKDYKKMTLKTEVGGVPHTYGIGGIHGAVNNYIGEGYFLMADVASYYPAMMIEYGFLSRNVYDGSKYEKIRDERLIMKANKDPRQLPRKIVLNSTFGAQKDQYNNLYDPCQANNICIAGQLLLTDLIEKVENHCQIIQSNTDGILMKLYSPDDKDMIIDICEEWSKRTRMDLEYDVCTRIIQKDVNNYILIEEDGSVKRKGSYVKKLKPLDNDLPIVNRAVVEYFVNGTPVEETVNASNDMIDFQKICKVGKAYEYVFKEDTRGEAHHYYKMHYPKGHDSRSSAKCRVENLVYNGKKLNTRVNRVFASTLPQHGKILKKKVDKTSLDKIGGTPDKCFTYNNTVVGRKTPDYLDRQWYINLAKQRINDFIGK